MGVSVDTRLLSESGRNEIKDDMKKTKVGFYDIAKDIITSDSLTILDSFSHQGNKVDMYDGVQNAIKNDTDLQEKLADPTLTKEDKNDMYHDNEKKVQEIVTFKQLQQEQLANRDFEGAKATGEEIARLDNDVEAFQNENGTGNQAVQNVFDEFDKIDETNVAVVETVVTIVGGRKLLKEVSDVSDDVVLSTGIKVNNTIQNKVIPAVKDGYYKVSNKFLGNPTKYTQGGIDFIDSALPHGIPTPSLTGGAGFGAVETYKYIKEEVSEDTNE